MILKRFFYSLTALVAGLALLGPAAAQAMPDDRFGSGITLVIPGKLEKPKKLDRVYATVVVPRDIVQNQPLAYDCSVQVLRRSPDSVVGIKNVRAIWKATVYVLNSRDSSFQVLDLGSGVIKTDSTGNGYAREIPVPPDVAAAIFTDGFESGDTSAWIMADAKLKKGKKTNQALFQCNLAERGR